MVIVPQVTIEQPNKTTTVRDVAYCYYMTAEQNILMILRSMGVFNTWKEEEEADCKDWKLSISGEESITDPVD